MSRLAKRLLPALLASTLGTVFLGSSPAYAESPTDCEAGGAWVGSGEGVLTNGVLNSVFCVDAENVVRQVYVSYDKDAGGTVTVKFGWQMVNNPKAERAYDTWWQSGTTRIARGEKKGKYFKYPTWSPAAFSTSWPCGRGVMRDTNTEVLYVTKVVCNWSMVPPDQRPRIADTAKQPAGN